jgi:formamidopyrimidine-DNA glycosylase
MPEGPEVRHFAIDLAKSISNRKLLSVRILSGRYLNNSPEGYEELVESCPLTVLAVGVHGKFLYWLLEDERSIWSTLGMTGQWSNAPTKHARVEFKLDEFSIYYNDTRNFGTLKFVQGKVPLIDKLESLGPDLLSEECSDEVFKQRIRMRLSKTITQALMDQGVVSGVGNYIKSDSLWLAKISPHRKVSSLTDDELVRLNRAIRVIMTSSFEHGGATIKTYKNFNGKSGEYGSRFLAYNRAVDEDGNEIIKEKTKDGRTTHWSPERQI